MAGIIAIFPNAQANLSDDIGVQISKTCITMIKNNLDTNCPTYEEIMFIFSDNSDQRVSGQFIFEDGYLQRDEPKIKNERAFYEQEDKFRMFIDPSADISTRVKLIVIESRLDEYVIEGQIVNSSSINVGHQRSVNEGCYRATLSATDWQFLLGDTIHYMNNDCDVGFTNFDSIKKITWERTIHDIVTSYKWQLENWIKESLERCGQRVCFYE